MANFILFNSNGSVTIVGNLKNFQHIMNSLENQIGYNLPDQTHFVIQDNLSKRSMNTILVKIIGVSQENQNNIILVLQKMCVEFNFWSGLKGPDHYSSLHQIHVDFGDRYAIFNNE